MAGSRKELEPGDVLGPYRLEAPIGEGGMGIVFRASRRDGTQIAVKVLKRRFAGDEEFRKRFRREARAAGEVRHQNLLPIMEADEDDGRPYIVVPYVPGGSLAERIKQGTLTLAEIVRAAGEVAAGLDALHAQAIIHRDVKPSNILFGEDGAALVTDFGLAKGIAYTALTKAGQVMGTVDYIAPELIKGKPATPLTDIYALGCTVFECLAGRPPFADRSMMQVAMAHLDEEPPDPCESRADVPPDLSFAVRTALVKDPAARPPTATAYVRLLLIAARPG